MPILIPDPCETTGCPNLAQPGQRHCLACLSQLADCAVEPDLGAPYTYPVPVPARDTVERAYVGLVLDAQREDPREVVRRQQQVLSDQLALIDNMEGEITGLRHQLALAESRERGLEKQIGGLVEQLAHYIDIMDTATQRNGGSRWYVRMIRRFSNR